MRSNQFRNPEDIVAAREILEKGCQVCARAEHAFGRAYCPNSLSFPVCRSDRKKGFKLIEVDE